MAAAYEWSPGQQNAYVDHYSEADQGDYYGQQQQQAETSQAGYYWSITSQSMPSSSVLPWDDEPVTSYAEDQPGILYRDSGPYGSVRVPTSQPTTWAGDDMLYSSTSATKYPFAEQEDVYSPYTNQQQELYYDDTPLYQEPIPSAYDYLSPLDNLSLDTSPQGTPLSTPLPQSPALGETPFLPVTLPPEEANTPAPSMHRRGALSFSLDSLNPIQLAPEAAAPAFKLSPLTKPPTTHFNYEESKHVSPLKVSTARPALSASTSSRRANKPYKQSFRKNGPDKTFKCDECEQSFNRNHDLKRHKRIHLTVKPFPCGWCDKGFSRKDALKRHLLVGTCGRDQGQRQEDSEKGISNAPSAVAYHEALHREEMARLPVLPPLPLPKRKESPPAPPQKTPAFLDTPSTSSESISTSTSALSSATSLSAHSPYQAYSWVPTSPPPPIAPYAGTCPPYLLQSHAESLGKPYGSRCEMQEYDGRWQSESYFS